MRGRGLSEAKMRTVLGTAVDAAEADLQRTCTMGSILSRECTESALKGRCTSGTMVHDTRRQKALCLAEHAYSRPCAWHGTHIQQAYPLAGIVYSRHSALQSGSFPRVPTAVAIRGKAGAQQKRRKNRAPQGHTAGTGPTRAYTESAELCMVCTEQALCGASCSPGSVR